MHHDASFDAKEQSSSNGKKRTKSYKKAPLDWLTEPYNHSRGETSLWVAVITQAMMDALSRSTKNEEKHAQFIAQRWLEGTSGDFTSVCLMAGFDPDYVRLKVKRTLANPSLWRAEAGQGKRYAERKAMRDKERAKESDTVNLPQSIDA